MSLSNKAKKNGLKSPQNSTYPVKKDVFSEPWGTSQTQNHISQKLEEDAIIYSHTENYQNLCSGCWEDETINHEHIKNEERHVVTGCIAAKLKDRAKLEKHRYNLLCQK